MSGFNQSQAAAYAACMEIVRKACDVRTIDAFKKAQDEMKKQLPLLWNRDHHYNVNWLCTREEDFHNNFIVILGEYEKSITDARILLLGAGITLSESDSDD
jgi:hypothetical protein